VSQFCDDVQERLLHRHKADTTLHVHTMTSIARLWPIRISQCCFPFGAMLCSLPVRIMPGPKMGPRPVDFDEEEIKKSPTFRKWVDTPTGGKLRYACREFVKGNEDDAERLMRRIMIARRNNVRDHDKLKRARSIASQKHEQPQQQQNSNENEGRNIKSIKQEYVGGAEKSIFAAKEDDSGEKLSVRPQQEANVTTIAEPSSQQRKRRYSTVFSDAEVAREMDVQAVEATRSYRAWMEVPDGSRFIYNQTYTKGAEGHDWMLRKNIWRRMRYRRENKKMMEDVLPDVDKVKETRISTGVNRNASRARSKEVTGVYFDDGGELDTSVAISHGVSTASQIVDQALLSTTPGVIDAIHTATTPNSSRHRHILQHQHRSTHEPTLESTAAEAAASIPHDPDTDAVVEAAVAAGECYSIDSYVHNPLETSLDGLGLALDAAARLAAAKAASMEAGDDVLAVVDPAPLPPNSVLNCCPQSPVEHYGSIKAEEELRGYVMEYTGSNN
jgi:hypothetical protein